MEDQGPAAFEKIVRDAKVKYGIRSKQYIGSLMELGMYYNRHDRFVDAQRVLTEGLKLIDSGVVKPSPKTPELPPIVQTHGDGTVSATNVNPRKPYEEMMENLLPALVQAEIATKNYKLAETHIKRQIALSAQNEVTGKLNLISAYTAYASLLRKLGRAAEAKSYEQKADAINKSFTPL